MTRYALDKVLWNYAREPEFKTLFDFDAAQAILERELSAEEREALVARDTRAMFAMGAHPFLLYSFTIALHGGWSMEMMKSYVDKLAGLQLRDIET